MILKIGNIPESRRQQCGLFFSLVTADPLDCANLDGTFSAVLDKNLLKAGRLPASFLKHLTKNLLANLHAPSESAVTLLFVTMNKNRAENFT